MPAVAVSDDLLIQALNLEEEYGSIHLALKAGAITGPRTTYTERAKIARLKGLRPTVRKDAPRIYSRKRLGRMHMVIPDVQSKPGVRSDHLEWVGNYAAEKRPDVIVCIGDFWDFPSLSRYDKGKLAFEGRRYVHDVDAGRKAMERLLKPIHDYNRTAKEKWHPEMHFTLGNHEIRLSRIVDENPEFMGKFDLDDLGIKEYGWQMHDFLKVIKIDGVEYSHYFTSGVMGRPVSSAATLLRERQCSATMGHVQHADVAMHKKTQQRALFCATCYLHDEPYLGEQGNSQRRQIIMKHEVEDGRYDLMEVSLNFLEKAYS
jgi:hypothetical protein